ncbi:MAG: SRPBCC domain-containing protein [Paracoccaceae bacterium]
MNSIARNPDIADLDMTRLFRAPLASLWRCWTEPALLEKWWAPSPVLTRDVVLDLQPGGRISATTQTPDGALDKTEYCVLAIAPMAEIVLTDMLSTGFRPARDPDIGFTAWIGFEAQSGGARYTVRLRHADAASRQRHEALGFHESWGIAASQLGALAESL